MGKLSPADVRAWFAELASVHPGRARKVYRVLRAILNTAVTDEIIVRNPCRVRGAGRIAARAGSQRGAAGGVGGGGRRPGRRH